MRVVRLELAAEAAEAYEEEDEDELGEGARDMSAAPAGNSSTRVVPDSPTEQPNDQPRTDQTEMTGPASPLPPINGPPHAQSTNRSTLTVPKALPPIA